MFAVGLIDDLAVGENNHAIVKHFSIADMYGCMR